MAYKAEGYVPPEEKYKAEGYKGTGNGPVMVPKVANPNLSTADTLTAQAATAAAPAPLLYMAALEKKYAEDMAAAQQPVQTAGTSGMGSILSYERTPDQMMAEAQRKRMAMDAAQQYNTAIGTTNPALLKPLIRWDL